MVNVTRVIMCFLTKILLGPVNHSSDSSWGLQTPKVLKELWSKAFNQFSGKMWFNPSAVSTSCSKFQIYFIIKASLLYWVWGISTLFVQCFSQYTDSIWSLHQSRWLTILTINSLKTHSITTKPIEPQKSHLNQWQNKQEWCYTSVTLPVGYEAAWRK